MSYRKLFFQLSSEALKLHEAYNEKKVRELNLSLLHSWNALTPVEQGKMKELMDPLIEKAMKDVPVTDNNLSEEDLKRMHPHGRRGFFGDPTNMESGDADFFYNELPELFDKSDWPPPKLK